MPALDALDITDRRPADRSTQAPQRLVVAWQHPDSRAISPIGFLSHDGQIYRFEYIRNAERVKGFQPLLGFPELRSTYTSARLFPLFAQRAMDPRRPDFHRYVKSLGLDGEPGPWEQITRSEGHRQGDTIQLLPEPTVAGDALTCLFLVHGIRHAHKSPKMLHGQPVSVTREQVEQALAQLKHGDELFLVAEPDNPRNPRALLVATGNVPVGYLPDLLTEDVQQLIHQADVAITVEHVNGPDAPWHLRLLARLRAAPAGDYRFFASERWEPIAGAATQ
jgi:HIRAN domain